ncbi:MAG: tetratricopeptide repeat protein [Bacteroidota bacterium]
MQRLILGFFFFAAIALTSAWGQFKVNQPNTETGDLQTGNLQFYLVRAETFLRQGNQIEAIRELDNAVNLSPNNPEILLHRAMLKYRLGMPAEANQDAMLAARLNPIAPALFGIEGPQARMNLLAFYPEELYKEVSWKDRLDYYEVALDQWYERLYAAENTPAYEELDATIVRFESILIALENEDWYKAKNELVTLLLPKGQYSIFHDLNGLVHFEIAEVDEAATAFREAINLDPNNAMAWYNLSKVSRYYENYEESAKHLSKAIKLQPAFYIAFFERALVKKAMGDVKGVIADYTTIIKRDAPNFLDAHFNRAISYKKIGQWTDALNDLEEILRYQSDDPLTWKVRGNLHLLGGRYTQAIADFTEAINLNSDLGAAYFNRGIAHLLNYNSMTACVDFERSANEGYERAVDKQQYFCTN